MVNTWANGVTIFKEGEPDERLHVRKSRITTQDGVIDGKTQTYKVGIDTGGNNSES